MVATIKHEFLLLADILLNDSIESRLFRALFVSDVFYLVLSFGL